MSTFIGMGVVREATSEPNNKEMKKLSKTIETLNKQVEDLTKTIEESKKNQPKE